MAAAVSRDDAPVEGSLRRIRQPGERAGILSDLRHHRYHEKPTERRTRHGNAVRRRAWRPGPA